MKDSGIVNLFRGMKWIIRTILVIIGVIPFARCNSGYKQKNGKVTFDGREMEGKGWIVLNESFAKNDSVVYYKSRAFEYADVATFAALDDHYAKDKYKVYYCDEYREGQNYYTTKKQTIVTIENAIPTSFEYIKDDYAKDEKLAYYKGRSFKVKDLATLALINERFLKDKYQVYFERATVRNADPRSFRVLNQNYAEDTSHIYYYGFRNEVNNGIHQIPCNKETFTLLAYPYSKDDAAVFYVYTKISGADPASFTTIWGDSSPEDVNYTKDKTYVFYKDKILPEVNVPGFKIVGLGYGADGRHVYFQGRIVKGADPATFKTYEHGFGDADSEDATHKYNAGVRADKEI